MYVNLSNQDCAKFLRLGHPQYTHIDDRNTPEVSMPALDRTDLIHLLTVVVATGLL